MFRARNCSSRPNAAPEISWLLFALLFAGLILVLVAHFQRTVSVHQLTWSNCAVQLSGHNRWSKIRHDKGKEDAAKSKARSHLAAEIRTASRRMYPFPPSRLGEKLTPVAVGGPEPSLNSRLAIAIANAKKAHLSKSSIENAIAMGQGRSLSGQALENVTIEAMLPHGAAVMVDCQTDNKNRTVSDMRLIISRAGGTVTPTAYLFAKKGQIIFQEQDAVGVDEAMEDVISAGGDDIDLVDNRLVVETSPSILKEVAQKLQESLGLVVESADVVHVPHEQSTVVLQEAGWDELQALFDNLEEDPSFRNVYTNAVSESSCP